MPPRHNKRVDPCHQNNSQQSLIDASRDGNVSLVRLLLKNGAPVNEAWLDGRTALMYACEKGHVEVVRVLLRHGARPNMQTSHGRTALICGSSEDHVEVVQLLLNEKNVAAAIDMSDDGGWTALLHASWYGNLEVVRTLLANGANVDATTRRENWTSLMRSCARGFSGIVRELLAHDAATEAKDTNWETALFHAVSSGGDTSEVIQILLFHGADANATNNWGLTPLMCADGYIKGVKTLLAHGANVNARNYQGRTALLAASTENRRSVVSTLLVCGAVVHVADADGEAPLFSADLGDWENAATSMLLLQHDHAATTHQILL